MSKFVTLRRRTAALRDGLDATTALLVCKKLRAIANGHGANHRAAVVTSIHQPRSSIMPLFDQCILLADGREVYAGSTYSTLPDGSLSRDGVMGWLEDVGYACPMFESPPDFLLDLINSRVDGGEDQVEEASMEDVELNAVAPVGGRGDANTTSRIRDRSVVVDELTAAWQTSERRKRYLRDGDGMKATLTSGDETREGASGSSARGRRHWAAVWCTRFSALFGRTFVFKLREPSGVATSAVNSVIIPLIIGSLYFQTPLTVGCVR